jgi:hypothetical protein
LRAAAALALGYILLPLVLISRLAFFRNPVVSSNVLVQRRYRR